MSIRRFVYWRCWRLAQEFLAGWAPQLFRAESGPEHVAVLQEREEYQPSACRLSRNAELTMTLTQISFKVLSDPHGANEWGRGQFEAKGRSDKWRCVLVWNKSRPF